MKNLTLLLALGGLVAASPACTVHNHYHGTEPGGYGPGRSSSVDGGGFGTGVGTGNGAGPTTVIVQTAPGNYPPPRPGGGRGPGGGNTGPVRNGGGNGPVRSGGGNTGPVRSGGQAGGGGNGSGTVAPVGTPTPPPKDPLYGTGGIKGPRPTTTPPANTTPDEPGNPMQPADPLAGTGGIKGPRRIKTKSEPGLQSNGTGGIRPDRMQDEEPAAPADPLAGTGGIKGPRPARTDGDEMPVRTIGTSELPGDGTGDIKPKGPAFVFTKFACMGACPSYTATVWADGRLRYEGQANVPRIGTFELRLDPATVGQLLQQARALGFAELQDHYASGATDIPATSLTVFRNGRGKTVTVEDNAPDAVNALFGNVAAAIGEAAGGGENRREER